MNKGEQGMAVLLLAVVMAGAIGIYLFAMNQRDALLVNEAGLSQVAERKMTVAQNLASTLRFLIDQERITVEAGPTLALAKGPLPPGWRVVKGVVEVAVCDYGRFRPSDGAPAFRDGTSKPGDSCGEIGRNFQLRALGVLSPDILRVKITALAKQGEVDRRDWTTAARIRVSGCLLPLAQKIIAFPVNFSPSAPGCPFAQFAQGNIAAADGVVTARKEQTLPLSKYLPQGTQVCALKFRSAPGSPTLYYDDAMFLHFGGALLMVTNNYLAPSFKSNPEGFQEYDWRRIVGKSYVSNATTAVCQGSTPGGCVVPPTETSGPIFLDFAGKPVRKMAEGIRSRNQPFSMTLVVSGDDNAVDCQASAITLDGFATVVQ